MKDLLYITERSIDWIEVRDLGTRLDHLFEVRWGIGMVHWRKVLRESKLDGVLSQLKAHLRNPAEIDMD